MVHRLKDILLYGVGAGIGVAAGEFLGEFMARVTNTSGVAGLAVRAATKTALAYLLDTLADGFMGSTREFTKIAGYGSVGSIVLDIVSLATPGGARGAGEAAAVAVRAAAMPRAVATGVSQGLSSVVSVVSPATVVTTPPLAPTIAEF